MHEQFHAKFKTDLDLARLPSGKFDTKALVCRLAAEAMNILHLIGERELLRLDAPVRHQAKRRRIKAVMQELIYRAGRLIANGRQMVLGIGANDRAATVFMRLHAQFSATAWLRPRAVMANARASGMSLGKPRPKQRRRGRSVLGPR